MSEPTEPTASSVAEQVSTELRVLLALEKDAECPRPERVAHLEKLIRAMESGSNAQPVGYVNRKALEYERVDGSGSLLMLLQESVCGSDYWDVPLYEHPPRDTECRSIAQLSDDASELLKREANEQVWRHDLRLRDRLDAEQRKRIQRDGDLWAEIHRAVSASATEQESVAEVRPPARGAELAGEIGGVRVSDCEWGHGWTNHSGDIKSLTGTLSTELESLCTDRGTNRSVEGRRSTARERET